MSPEDGSGRVLAAGAVLWRPGPDDRVEVAVVHRPRYDDWSLPKGKPDPSEPLPLTAVREVTEETGFGAVLGRRLPATSYPVRAGDKTVYYWLARATEGRFVPNAETDELRWLEPAAAGRLLSHAHDRSLVAALDGAPAGPALLLVRHAKAGSRDRWAGDDDLRPLSEPGRAQAAALRRILPAYGVTRVHSAPRTRCRQTVQAVADDLGVTVTDEPLLSEEGYAADSRAARQRLDEIRREGAGVAAVCSQGGAIPDLVAALLAGAGMPDRDVPSRKGSFWVLSFGPGGTGLLAADYYDAPA